MKLKWNENPDTQLSDNLNYNSPISTVNSYYVTFFNVCLKSVHIYFQENDCETSFWFLHFHDWNGRLKTANRGTGE